ncbi:MAG: hypothetical protein AMXMBFR64_53970 [Myxococcales bacterium]
MLIDIQVRTSRSAGGALSLGDIVTRARNAGIDAVCVAELGVQADMDEVLSVERSTGFPIFVGVELPTDRGSILAYPPSFDDADYLGARWGAPGEDSLWRLDDLLSWLHDNDWAVVVAHPGERVADGPRLADDLYGVKGLHGIVVAVEGGDPLAGDLAVEAAVSRGVAGLGTSGGAQSLDAIGRFATLIPRVIHTQGELARALQEGDAWTVELSDRAPAPDPGAERRGGRSERGERGGRDERGDRGGRGDRRGGGRGRR